jgi:hypothetical protein
MCTSPFKVKKGGCMGEIDFGHGIQYEIKGKERQRYCVSCHDRICRGEDSSPEEPDQKESAKTTEPETTTKSGTKNENE